MTTTFSVSGGDLVNASLRLTGRFGAGDTIPMQDQLNVLQALNILVKSLVTAGLPLWAIEDVPIPLIAGQGSYTVGPSASGAGAVVANRPMKVEQAILTNSAGNNTVINVVSRYDYNSVGLPSSQGVPNEIWYYPTNPNGVITMYNVPSDSLSVLTIVSQRTFNDFNTFSDTPDFPQEWYAPLKWLLTDEISLEYECKPNVVAKVEKMAKMYRDIVSGWGKEEVPVRFVPSARFARGK